MRTLSCLVVCIFLVSPGCQDYGGTPDSGQPDDDGETVDPDEPFKTDDIPWHDDIPWYDDDVPWHDDIPGYDDGFGPPDTPTDSGPLCDRPGQPGQGRDQDGDMWGEYCDCNNLNPRVFPWAIEICDGLDNDCDGQVNPPGTCVEECPNISGDVQVVTDCVPMSPMTGTIHQDGCEFLISVMGFEFTGLIHPDWIITVNLEPLGLSCEGRVHRSFFPVGLECGGCTVRVFPDELDCWRNQDCPTALSCQKFVDYDIMNLYTACGLGGGPNTDNTGEACVSSGDCYSKWCFDYPSYCTGVCLTDQACPSDFACVTQVIDLDLSASGERYFDWMNVCAPLRQPCETNANCQGGRVCELVADPTELEGYVKTCGQEYGAGWLGAACDDALLDGCATGVCVADGRYCSTFCVTDQDCLDPAGVAYECRRVPVEIWPGYHLPVRVCAR